MGYGDRALYSRWALESLPQWKDLLADAGQPALFRETGVLWLGHDEDPHVDVTARTLDRLGVMTESLAPADLESRFPALDFTGITRGVFEPGSGVLLARRAVNAVANQAARGGVDYRMGAVEPPTPSRRIDSVGLGDGRRLSAGVFVFACGPWLPKLFPDLLGPVLRTTRQEVFFFGDARCRPPLCASGHAGLDRLPRRRLRPPRRRGPRRQDRTHRARPGLRSGPRRPRAVRRGTGVGAAVRRRTTTGATRRAVAGGEGLSIHEHAEWRSPPRSPSRPSQRVADRRPDPATGSSSDRPSAPTSRPRSAGPPPRKSSSDCRRNAPVSRGLSSERQRQSIRTARRPPFRAVARRVPGSGAPPAPRAGPRGSPRKSAARRCRS